MMVGYIDGVLGAGVTARQIQSLKTILGSYFLNAFGSRAYEELHFGETVEGLAKEFVDQRVRSLCAAVAADRASDQQGNEWPGTRTVLPTIPHH